MKYLIPGLQQTIDIPFPDRKLPVCKRCKKIYKTRELCRVRDGHTDVPWNTSYICFTLDDSCFTHDSQGNICLESEGSKKFVAQSLPGPPMSYRAKEGHIKGAKAPICMACKDKNYTRHHCREKQKHQQLPWGTVYVLLSTVPSTPASRDFPPNNMSATATAGLKRLAENISDISCVTSNTSSGPDDGSSSKRMKGDSSTSTSDNSTCIEQIVSDDIRKIEPSRAFLLTINKDDSCVLHWLEIDPLAPMSEAGPSWINQCESIDQGSMHHHSSHFGSDAYPPPSGWSGYENTNHSEDFSPGWNSNINREFSGPPSQSFNQYEPYNNYFPDMQQNGMNSTYTNNFQQFGGHHMYSEDENCNRSNMIHPSTQKNSFVPHQNDGCNRNFESHPEPINSGPNIEVQYRNQDHGGPGPSYPHHPLQQTEHFQYLPKRSHSIRPLVNRPCYSDRFENYRNDRGEEWNSWGRPQANDHQQPHLDANRGNQYRGKMVLNV